MNGCVDTPFAKQPGNQVWLSEQAKLAVLDVISNAKNLAGAGGSDEDAIGELRLELLHDTDPDFDPEQPNW